MVTGISSISQLAVGQSSPAPASLRGRQSWPSLRPPSRCRERDGQRRPESFRQPRAWLVENTSVGPANPAPFWFTSGTAFGPSNVTPFQGDFDGDGLTDLAYYQSSTATWYIDDSQNKTITSFTLGTPNMSVPVVGTSTPMDQTRPAVFTIVNGQGVWTIANGGQTVTFGQTGDIPVPGDYTGVGYDELAVYRPSTGQFLVLVPGAGVPRPPRRFRSPVSVSVRPTSAASSLCRGPTITSTISTTTNPRYTEAAVYDPNTGVYTILGPTGAYTVTFDPGDIPAPADYLGNGSTQPVVFRPSTGQFIEAGGTVIATFSQASADIPLAAPLSYRTPATTDPLSTGDRTGQAPVPAPGRHGHRDRNWDRDRTGTGTGTGTRHLRHRGKVPRVRSSATGRSGGTSTPQLVIGTPPPTVTSWSQTQSGEKEGPSEEGGQACEAEESRTSCDQEGSRCEQPAKKVIKVSTSHTALAQKPTHVVDLALEGVHVNLRRSHSGKKG